MKIFAISDIHGHGSILKKALQEAGFDSQNPDHLLVCCGDCFDRGRENRLVMEFLQSIPNKILVRGNHEDILEKALLRGSIGAHEIRNGTIRTIEEFFGEENIDEQGVLTMDPMVKDEVLTFMRPMRDYFETKNYVFTHGWIPLNIEWGEIKLRKDWRTASVAVWKKARFTGWNQVYPQRLMLSDKTVVCGHRGARYGSEFDPTRPANSHDPFTAKGVIAIDGLTITSGQVNVMVLEDELLPFHTYPMQLKREHFESVANGSKIIEMRLYDEKRRKIRVGDFIEFTCADAEEKKILTQVRGIHTYPGFDELVEEFRPVELGFDKTDPGKISEYMLRLYGVEETFKNKVVALRVSVIQGEGCY